MFAGITDNPEYLPTINVSCENVQNVLQNFPRFGKFNQNRNFGLPVPLGSRGVHPANTPAFSTTNFEFVPEETLTACGLPACYSADRPPTPTAYLSSWRPVLNCFALLIIFSHAAIMKRTVVVLGCIEAATTALRPKLLSATVGL